MPRGNRNPQCTDTTCDGAYSRYDYLQPANPGDPSASASLNDSLGNSVFASATLGNAAVDGAPVLRASSTSIAGNYNVASAAALQSHTTLPTGQSFDAGTTPTDNMNALLGITTQSGSQSLGDNLYQSSVATAGSTGDASVTITLQQGVTY